MSEPVRVLVQMRSTPSLAAAAFGPSATAPQPTLAAMAGVQFDGNYSPVPLPPAGGFAAFATAAVPAAFAAPTYLVRAAVQPERLAEFLGRAAADASVVGVFADPRLQAVAPVCPTGPVGTDADVAERLAVPRLAAKGLDGAGCGW